jgi:hypothetical protein
MFDDNGNGQDVFESRGPVVITLRIDPGPSDSGLDANWWQNRDTKPSQELMLGRFHHWKESREMNDPGCIGVAEFDPTRCLPGIGHDDVPRSGPRRAGYSPT